MSRQSGMGCRMVKMRLKCGVDKVEWVCMDNAQNPFTPGAGSLPPEMAGRADVMQMADTLFARTLNHRAEKSMLLNGLRGVGKTVLLNHMRHLAEQQGYKTVFMEAQAGRPLAVALAPYLRSVLYDLDLMAQAGQKLKRALQVLRNFIGVIKIDMGDFGIGLEPLPGKADSGILTVDLPELLLAVAEAAEEKKTGVALFIDELQLVAEEELEALIVAMHKLQQVQAPLVLVAAGLPNVRKKAGNAKTYAERLFAYPEIGRLNRDDAAAALAKPFAQAGFTFTPEAAQAVYSQTLGYPYFLQEWGYQLWHHHQEQNTLITLQDVEDVTQNVLARLDENFFRIRYDRLTETQRLYMRAMAEFPPDACRSAAVAALLGKDAKKLTPTRDKLIREGMIYSPSYGELRYSVPLFGDFMRRVQPDFPHPAAGES